jgi:alpha-galactosidase/6-phospho-beta-glucosidase family protein
MKNNPKVVLVGAGSLFFGQKAIWGMTHMEGLKEGTLALVDSDPNRLKKMQELAKKTAETAKSPLKIEASTNHQDVLKGADFVVLSFSHRNAHFRRIDCQVSEKYGIRMCSGDTIGPGGVFRTLRELPTIMKVAKDVERLTPEAWVVNYINPTSVNGIGLMRHSKVKSFALCDTLHMPFVKRKYMRMAGLENGDESKFHLEIAGVNHFTWVLKAEYEGRDVTPKIVETIRANSKNDKDEGYAKGRFNASYSAELYDVYGSIPACVSHTKEYFPYWQAKRTAPKKYPDIAIFDCDEREVKTAEMWKRVDGFIDGSISMDEFHTKLVADHAIDVINAMWTNNKKPYYVNTTNKGAVSNMPDDSFLELLCDLDMNGPRPRKVSPFPIGIRGWQMHVLDVHELTAEAAITKNRNLVRRALVADPLTTAMEDIDAAMEELFQKQQDILDWGLKEKNANKARTVPSTKPQNMVTV